MNITGLITEYNPFHKGHKHHYQSSLKICNSDITIAIMSGNFVQRGEPALIDKWTRAKMAVCNGVDLVIELPCLYALSTAELFSRGAVEILNSLGIIDNIFFGSECGDITQLKTISQILIKEDELFKALLKDNLSSGISFASAREKAISQYTDNNELKDILKSSNNILGVEYIKALLKLNSKINPITIKREGSNYNDLTLSNTFSSATSIRKTLGEGNSLNTIANELPNESFDIISDLHKQNYNFVFPNHMYDYIKHRLLTNCVNFNNLIDVSEGLDNKFLKEICTSKNLNDFILSCKSKRYTYTKISRLCAQTYIGFDTYDVNKLYNPDLLYCRVLSFNSKGQTALKLMKKKSSIPIITKVPKHHNNELLKLDIQATKAYSLLNPSINPMSDYLKSPEIVLKNSSDLL